MNFKATLDNSFNMQMDVLADIYCWQQIILDRLASWEAEQNDCSKEEVMEVWESRKVAIRKDLIEQLYAKHGPDLSGDLLK